MIEAKNGPESAVIFLHIPKTAGSTLHQIIRRQYPARHIYHIGSQADSLARFQGLPVAKRAQIEVLMGHFEMGIDRYLPQPTTYFTMLRQPVARAISYFAHIRRDKNHYCHELVTTGKMSLAAFVDSGADVMMDNGQTRLLAGVRNSVPYGECGPNELQAAKRNLEDRFAFAGLTEKFDRALLLMSHFFGWRNLYYQRRNVSAQQEKRRPNRETLAQIRAANSLDMDLYQWAESRLTQQLAHLGPSFGQQLARFRQLNRFFGPLAHYGDELRLRLLGPTEQ